MGVERILVIEDNIVQQKLFAAILERAGYVVDTLKDAIQALDHIEQVDYAAIILDLRLAIFDGNQFLDYLQSARPELVSRVVVVTAFSSLLMRVPIASVAAVLQKPVKAELLLECVRKSSASATAVVGEAVGQEAEEGAGGDGRNRTDE